MSEWKNFSLGEVAEVTKLAGFEFTKYISYVDDGEIIALRALNLRNGILDLTNVKKIKKSVSDKLIRSKLFANDILLTYTGNGYGDCALVSENDKYHLAPNICKISPNTNIVVPYYLYSYIRSKAFKIKLDNSISGSAQPTIPMKTLRILKVPLFDLLTQKKIAAVLSALDDKIELNNAINKNLEEQAQAIFKSWFIDFEPFGGKMPDDWRIEEFQSLLTERREKSNNPKLKLFSVTDNGILPREERFKKKLSKSTTINKVIYQGDLIFGMSRKILNWGVMRDYIGAVSSAYNIFSVSEKVNSKYLESFIKQNIIYFHDLIRPASREGQGLDKGILMRKKIYLPDDETLKKYYEIEDALTATANITCQENQKLGEIRDALLPRLMSGEIDVSAVEI